MRIKSGNETVKLFAFLVLLQIFLIAFPMAKASRTKNETLTQNFSYMYFAKLPKNPNVYKSVTTYSDAELSKKASQLQPNSKIGLKKILTNKKGTPVFQLGNGTYAKASFQDFYDDKVLTKEALEKPRKYWTSDRVVVYQDPYVSGASPKKSSLAIYSKIQISQQAETHHSRYFYVKGQGWLDEKTLTLKDVRIEKVEEVLKKKYADSSKYSIYVKQLDSGKVAQINADKPMYSASVSKLPLLYYVQDQLNKGKIKASQSLTYSSAVNSFKDAYKTEGSGTLSKTADNKPYTISDLERHVTQYSDNVATNILGYYVAHQYDKDFQKTIKSAIGEKWDMKERKVSAKTAGKMMEAIYKQNGDITDYLASTDYDNQRISKNISVKVAHKIGDAYDYRHDVAIVYGDTPFILSIFTENASYDDITAVADDVYRILRWRCRKF